MLIVSILITAGITFYLTTVTINHLDITPAQSPSPSSPSGACTQDAKQCPDGSFVGRTGPNCQFTACPTLKPSSYKQCKSNADCPSRYICEATEGTGIISSEGGDNSFQITKGECKLKEGNSCSRNTDCAGGLACNRGICVSPIGKACSGHADRTCASGYQCIQSCGPPVGRDNDPPPPYFCQLIGYEQACPICLAANTTIATPNGNINVKDLKIRMPVWSVNKSGQKVLSKVAIVSHTPVPATHQVVHLVLADQREVWVSPGHPIANRSGNVGQLRAGDSYDGSRIITADLVSYREGATYDLLPDSDTGYYWANGILLGSTLKQ